jgi:cation:H+ antiporter
MLVALGLLAAGALVLYVGAEAAVRGAARMARVVGVPAFVLGALLFGLDIESLGAAVAAAARGETALAAGEIVGTVLFLYGPAFGIALLASRRPVPSPEPILVLAPSAHLVAGAFALADRYVTRLEGVLLVLLYLAYVILLLRTGLARGAADEIERDAASPRSTPIAAVATIGGLAMVAVGAAVAVTGASRIVEETGLAAGFVGAAILAVVVGLDEVLLEVLPVRKGTPGLATGNLFGTLPAFAAGALGVAAVIHPLDVDSAAAAGYLVMAFLYAVVATVFLVRERAGRALGVFLVLAYAAWLVAGWRL